MTRLILPLLLVATAGLAADMPAVVTHDATITFDVDSHTVTIVDRVDPGDAGAVQLDAGLTPGGDRGELASESREIDAAGELAYVFTAHQPTDEVQFSRERVGGEITATVGPEGIYLSSGVAWLATVEEAMHAGSFTIDTPAGWYPVMSGRLVAQEENGGRWRTTYEIAAEAPVDGISLVANTYAVTERDHDGVTMRICLLEPDERLRETYLERTAFYLDLYGEMIGPYPYDAFTTVENWFPTGYGMPGWTLLGAQVIRLPFIPYTSFGHEIAHNWWGNSVFVDPGEGNWCEGLTVYCADYEYKRLEGEDQAREYRRNQLKDYAAYVGGHPERDFALREFKARHSGATRAVGYGKSMAIWRMLEVELGRETVLAALQRVYRDFRGKPAAWSDFFAALEAASGRDLMAFKAQWIDRTGAPTITLGEADVRGEAVVFTLHQEGDPYDLHVPVRIATTTGAVDELVRLDAAEKTFRVTAPGATAISVDPDFDVFRHLHASEIEPTLSRVLAAEEWTFAAPTDDLEFQPLAEAFAAAFCECDAPRFTGHGKPEPGGTNVIINPPYEVLMEYAPEEFALEGPIATVAGEEYSVGSFDIVFAADSPHGTTDLIVMVGDPRRLPGYGRRLPHYGKYSYLVFPVEGGRPVRGNWMPRGGPLHAELLP
ncbi:hypothetical protein GF314_04055 [bacterium]|nr:hypothetical protein [bacterium]